MVSLGEACAITSWAQVTRRSLTSGGFETVRDERPPLTIRIQVLLQTPAAFGTYLRPGARSIGRGGSDITVLHHCPHHPLCWLEYFPGRSLHAAAPFTACQAASRLQLFFFFFFSPASIPERRRGASARTSSVWKYSVDGTKRKSEVGKKPTD